MAIAAGIAMIKSQYLPTWLGWVRASERARG
jgi:hypothetical protein